MDGRAEGRAQAITRKSLPPPADELEHRLLTHRSPGLAGLGLPPDLVLPDYARSIANLPATVAAMLGANLPGALTALPGAWWEPLAPGVKRVVLLILDAVGWLHFRQYLSQEGGSVFHRLAGQGHLLPISSIFPGTTTVALTSLWTGHSAAGHGLVGHDLFFPSLGMMVDTLGFTPAGEPRDERLIEGGLVPETLVPVQGLAQLLAGQGISTQVLIHRSFAESGLSRLQFRGASRVDGFASTADLCVALRDRLSEQRDERRLLVVYWANMDTIGHLRGPDSAAWPIAPARRRKGSLFPLRFMIRLLISQENRSGFLCWNKAGLSKVRTRRNVSLPGIPCGNARCPFNHRSFRFAQLAIAVGPSAVAITAQMAITITSPSRWSRLTSDRGSGKTARLSPSL